MAKNKGRRPGHGMWVSARLRVRVPRKRGQNAQPAATPAPAADKTPAGANDLAG